VGEEFNLGMANGMGGTGFDDSSKGATGLVIDMRRPEASKKRGPRQAWQGEIYTTGITRRSKDRRASLKTTWKREEMSKRRSARCLVRGSRGMRRMTRT